MSGLRAAAAIHGARYLRSNLGIEVAYVRALTALNDDTVTAARAGLGKGAEPAVRFSAVSQQSPMPSPTHEAVAAPSDALRILVVDDDVDSADSLVWILQASGHPEPRVAYSGGTALAVAEEFRPAVILLDLNLPGIGGFEVARLLHQHAQLRDTRLIALTTSSEHFDRERARAAGFERYLVKPVAASALEELLAMPPH